MKKFILTYLLNIVLLHNLASQDRSELCNKLLYGNHHKNLPANLHEYIKEKYKSKTKFLNKKAELQNVERQISTSNSILFSQKDFSILIKTKRDSIFINKDSVDSYYSFDTGDDDEFSKIKFYLSSKIRLSGNINMNDVKNNYFYFYRFDKIEITNKGDKFNIPDSLINSYINPNLFNNYLAIKPLAVYKIKSRNYFCIYLTGQFDVCTEDDKEYFADQNNTTYYTKMVIDLDLKKIEILDLNYGILKFYGWPLCKDTWLF